MCWWVGEIGNRRMRRKKENGKEMCKGEPALTVARGVGRRRGGRERERERERERRRGRKEDGRREKMEREEGWEQESE